jgi:hypothetical protein
MRPNLTIHSDNDAVESAEFRHVYVTKARRRAIQAALLNTPNARDQQIAAKGLFVPKDALASLLHRLVRHDLARLLSKKLLILVVVTNPIPEERVILEDRQSSIASANADRPDGSALLEAQRRMPRVSLPKTICSTRPAFDLRGKPSIRRPEVTRCR